MAVYPPIKRILEKKCPETQPNPEALAGSYQLPEIRGTNMGGVHQIGALCLKSL